MPKRISSDLKMDIGLLSQVLNNTNATGKYFNMSMYGEAAFVLNGGAMAATKTTIIEILQAKDAAGTNAKALTDLSGAAVSATITANTNVTEATLTLAAVAAGDTVTINGVVFTAHASTTTPANREFSIAGVTDTLDAVELASVINNATYGVPGVTATAAAAVITLSSTAPGATVITASTSGATVTIATTQAQSYIDFKASHLDLTNGFTHVAAKVTTTANSNVSVGILRGVSRFQPDQKVGASKVV